MINRVLEYFYEMCKIPHISHSEEKLCEYLSTWAENEGFKVTKNIVSPENPGRYNVIIDVPATKGYEDKPLTVLQAHMDMVAATEKAHSPIISHLVYDEEKKILKSDGTVNIGADDCLGVATIQYIITEKSINHGPLRAIFTLDEEDGMDGAENLPAEFVSDAKYLINADWEDAHSVCTSCAGGMAVSISADSETEKTSGNAYEITLSGFCGGHSGTEIHKGYANAIISLSYALIYLKNSGIDFNLAKITGGNARNAIPDFAKAVIYVTVGEEKLCGEVLKAFDEFKAIYGDIERNAVLKCEKAINPQNVMYTKSLTERLLSLIITIPDGVNTMSSVVPGLVESSSNLGLISCDEKNISLEILQRSSVQGITFRMEEQFKRVGEAFSFNVNIHSSYPGWAAKRNSNLTELTNEGYKNITGKDMKIEPIHAGLECGFFSSKNPEIDIVSIGATVLDIHTTQETAYLDTLPITVGIIKHILENI